MSVSQSKLAHACPHDVVIAGGGLAGLTLALQLRQTLPELSVTVVERKSHPVREAAHKVGESTVEIGARYLSHTLGLEDHLREHQLKKYGLRFFFGGRNKTFCQADEMGTSALLDVTSYQLDRGRLENELARRAVAAGAELIDSACVTEVAVNGKSHTVSYTGQDGAGSLQGRWLIDAANRAAPLKRHLQLAQPNTHRGNAAWFRINRRIQVDDWASSSRWQNRCPDLPRWQSTNHLMGPGYWVWIIPLAGGATSVGIVADPRLHPLSSFGSFKSALSWLATHQPHCRAAIGNDQPMDFRVLREYSHGAREVFSAERWGLTGEAGVFLDPFYSPGSDFIAISNSYLTQLIGRESRGDSIQRHSRLLQQLYFSFYQSTLSLYEGLYPGFGDRNLMVLKAVWDYAYYWAILGILFFTGGLWDERVMLSAGPDLLKAQETNRQMQAAFSQRALLAKRSEGVGAFIDQREIPCFRRLNRALLDPLSGDALIARMADNSAMLSALGPIIRQRLSQPQSPINTAERTFLGDLGERLNA